MVRLNRLHLMSEDEIILLAGANRASGEAGYRIVPLAVADVETLPDHPRWSEFSEAFKAFVWACVDHVVLSELDRLRALSGAA